jgi:hypothetical protein
MWYVCAYEGEGTWYYLHKDLVFREWVLWYETRWTAQACIDAVKLEHSAMLILLL